MESNDEYSSTQVMLRSGHLETFETAEAGWAVSIIFTTFIRITINQHLMTFLFLFYVFR